MAPARLNHVGGKREGAADDAARDPSNHSDARHGRSGRHRAVGGRVARATAFLLLKRCGPSRVRGRWDLVDRRVEVPHRISCGIPRARNGRLRVPGARFVDHSLEEAAHRDTEARRLRLDPGAPLVVEPDAYNRGLCGRHDPLTVTRGVYSSGAEWWQPGGGWSGPGRGGNGSRCRGRAIPVSGETVAGFERSGWTATGAARR
jgi:hypothetical protein